VYDHCNAIDLIVRKGQLGESYNVGGDAEHANIDLAKAICAKLDALVPKANSYADQLEFVEDRAGHDWRYAINHDKLTAELGWGVSSTLDVGLTQTIAFYIQKYQ
jgi:dTDP-glucose 4,6-dehydratase